MNVKKIVIDARMHQQSGIGRYIRNLIGNLQDIDTKNEYYILHLKEDFQRHEYHKNFHKVLADVPWYGLKEQIKQLKLINSLQADLVHFPHFNVPFLFTGKYLVTIHDLIHQHFSMERATTRGPLIYKIKQLGYGVIFKNALVKSQRILTPSNFVKKQLMDGWKVSNEKIIVTPEAVDDKILSIGNSIKKAEMDKVLKRFEIVKPYLFYVGNAHPHKNIEGLINVFKQLKKQFSNLSLVLSGNDHYFWQRVIKENQHKDITYTGFIDDTELVVLYKQAAAFVMPSLEEGFGIPILEAMVCGCPVASSEKGSLPEVGGDAAVYFNPNNTSEMFDVISKILTDEKLKKSLVIKGKERAGQFSWKRLSQETLEVYNQCV